MGLVVLNSNKRGITVVAIDQLPNSSLCAFLHVLCFGILEAW